MLRTQISIRKKVVNKAACNKLYKLTLCR